MISNIQLHTCSSLHRYQPKSLTHQIVNSTAGEAGTQAAQASPARAAHLDLATGEDGANPLGEAGTQASPERVARTEDGVVLHLGVLHLGVLAHLGASLARAAQVDGAQVHGNQVDGAQAQVNGVVRAASPNRRSQTGELVLCGLCGAHQLGVHQDGTQASLARDLVGLEMAGSQVHLGAHHHLGVHQDGASQARAGREIKFPLDA